MSAKAGRWTAFFLVTIALIAINGRQAATANADEPRLADYFGFLPLEIYKLDQRISHLLLRDLDGDKVDDIVVSNNSRSRIEILLSGKAKDSVAESTFPKPETNEVVNDRRMRLQSVPVNKEIVSLSTGDFNGDGKPDLVFQGNPTELVILFNQGDGKFDNADGKRIPTGEVVESGSALTVGDLDRDGRDDVALLGPNEIILVLQTEKGKFTEPERLPHTCSGPRIMKAVDIDGDGALDLSILDESPTAPIHIRFSAEDGKLGPEQIFAIENPRAIAYGNVDKKPGAEILTLDGQSGRVRVSTLDDSSADESTERGRLIFYPLPPGNQRGRSLAVGDLDADGKADVVVTDPANAQFLFYKQSAKGGLEPSRTFPGLAGGKTLKLADLDQDGKADLVVLSEQEKQIARCSLVDGRISFPTALPLSGEPAALEVADLDADGLPEVLYISRTKVKDADEYSLRALKREKSGVFVPYRWGQDDSVAVKSLQGTPAGLRALDINQDKLADILILNSYGSPILLLGRNGEAPAPAGGSLAPLTDVGPGGLTVTDLDGPALIVSQNSFARNILLDKNGRWDVKDQYNTGQNSSKIVGSAALDTNGDGKKEVVLLDRVSKSLVYLEKKEGGYRPSATVPFGPIEFLSMHVADLDADGKDDLLVAGSDRFGVVLTGKKPQRLKMLASFESKRHDARFADLILGDLNSDSRPDITLLDIGEHSIEIASVSDKSEIFPAISFKVFERKSFGGGGDALQPRDLVIGDVDGDSRPDLVVLAHDRLLVYRQDSGEKEKEKKDQEKPAELSGQGKPDGAKPN